MKIGKLVEVNVRELWKHEQYDFSNWLAKEENIEHINQIIGLTLVDIEQEVKVGAYRCDIVAKDEASDTVVIIENQLEMSDHDHLGKVISYASGLSAEVIVWVVKEARDEHKSAIEWLNSNTDKKIGFFLVELKAYRIGDSIPAPKFEVVEKPNDFLKNIKSISGQNTYNKSQSERLEFWTLLNEEIIKKGTPFNTRKVSTDHWYSVAIGSSDAHINILLVNKERYVGIEVNIPDKKELFDYLLSNKMNIEDKIGIQLEWQRLEGKKACRIMCKIDGLNFDNHDNYTEIMAEIIDVVTKMKPVFNEYVKSYK